MDTIRKLPIGIENFEDIRTKGFYYVDKTSLIKELLSDWGMVTLFTRPRRFGKSLNMSMLKCFFEYECRSELFQGLEIAEEQELCEAYMGKFPVVSITLKGVSGLNYAEARGMLCSLIRREALRFGFLKNSVRLSEDDMADYRQLVRSEAEDGRDYVMAQDVLADSLLTLCRLLHKHYGQKVVLLIDEYDVPLDKAQHYGYYEEMVALMRNLLGQGLKTNDSLQFAVLTGCLRLAKESIFTGLNNLRVMSITNIQFDEYFGFTDNEVKEMLGYYGLEEKYELTQKWYDGYHFGNKNVYCPWDVINYVSLLCRSPEAQPCAFWVNTSGNEIVRNFLKKTTAAARRELEKLIEGECVAKKVNQELTYRDLYDSLDNLWSVLFTTGYLTKRGEAEGKVLQLAIPNLEIREIFVEQVLEWFQEDVRKDAPKLDAFCVSFLRGDAATAEELFNSYLMRTISVRDAGVRKGRRESFYHGILLGLLSHREDWVVESNMESGEGYSDILVEVLEEGTGIVIEIKYEEAGNLEAGCIRALAQIEEKKYVARLLQDGMETILKYGIACSGKRCRVKLETD